MSVVVGRNQKPRADDCFFRATLGRGGLLLKILQTNQDFFDQVNLECGASGISIHAPDAAHVALIEVELPLSVFESYHCVSGKHLLGIQSSSLIKILKFGGATASTTLSCRRSDTLEVVLVDGRKISTLDLKLFNLDSETVQAPKGKQLEAVVRMPALEFQNLCKRLSTVSNETMIQVTRTGVRFSIKGDVVVPDGNIFCGLCDSEKDEERLEIELSGGVPLCASFSLYYLHQFAKMSCLSTRVLLGLRENAPILVEYAVGGESNGGLVRYYLAPKIPDDDDEDEDGEPPTDEDEAAMHDDP